MKTYLSSYAMSVPVDNKKQSASDISLPAAQLACKDIDVSTIDGIIFATMTRDYVYPSSACMLSKKLGLKSVFVFDIDSDFTGFVSALILASSFVKSARYNRILVVASEAMSVFSDSDIFMNGAVAALVTNDIEKNDILYTSSTTDGSKLENCYIPMGGSAMPYTKEGIKEGKHKIHLKDENVFLESAKTHALYCKTVLKENDLNVGLFAPSFHNKLSHDCLLSSMSDFGIDKDSVYSGGIFNLDDNNKMRSTGAASSGISFVSAIESGFARSGDRIAICAYGSGITNSLAVLNIS